MREAVTISIVLTLLVLVYRPEAIGRTAAKVMNGFYAASCTHPTPAKGE